MSAAVGRFVVDLLVVEMVVSVWNVGNTGDNEPLQLVPPRACVQDLGANDLGCTRSLGSPPSPQIQCFSPVRRPSISRHFAVVAPLHGVCPFAPLLHSTIFASSLPDAPVV